MAKEGQLDEARKLLSEAHSKRALVYNRAYSGYIAALATKDDIDNAKALFYEVESHNLPQTATFFGALIALAVGKNQLEFRDFLITKLKAKKVMPELSTQQMLVQDMVARGEMVKLYEFLDTIPEDVQKISLPDIFHFIATKADVTAALVVFDYMQAKGIRPSGTSCNLLIAQAIRKDKRAEAVKAFERFKAVKLVNAATYSSLMQNVSPSACEEMFKQMQAAKILPNLTVYNTVMQARLSEGDAAGCLALYDEMTESGINPTSRTYANLIRAHSSDFQKSRETLMEAIGNSMADGEVVSAAIQAAKDDYDAALDIYRTATKHGRHPSMDGYIALAQHATSRELWIDCLRLLEDMEQEKVTVPAEFYGAIYDVLARKDEKHYNKVFGEMLDTGRVRDNDSGRSLRVYMLKGGRPYLRALARLSHEIKHDKV